MKKGTQDKSITYEYLIGAAFLLMAYSGLGIDGADEVASTDINAQSDSSKLSSSPGPSAESHQAGLQL